MASEEDLIVEVLFKSEITRREGRPAQQGSKAVLFSVRSYQRWRENPLLLEIKPSAMSFNEFILLG